MFEDTTLGPRILANPSMSQALAIQAIEDRTNGTISIADPNCALNLTLEANCSIVGEYVRYSETEFESLYALRTRTADQLYRHMSDYDYVKTTYQPAPVLFRLLLNRDWIIANAVQYDADYNRVDIPATTVVTMGTRQFGMYYPIQMMINRTTGVITVTYDTSVTNPLYTLSSNVIDDVTEYNHLGLNYLALSFQMYQFYTDTKTETFSSRNGFSKTYSITKNFYAIRVFTMLPNASTWTELSYALSQSVYDPTVATVLVTILEDDASIKLQIPQIYFANDQIGTQLKIFIYTTDGALDVVIPESDADSVTADFDVNSTPYAAILAQAPTCEMIPNQAVINGGSNGMSFTQMRNAVVNGSLYNPAPINPLQREALFQEYGFNCTTYVDNITNRIFFASKQVINTDTGDTVPVAVAGILLSGDSLKGNPGTILSFTDALITILPTTIFKYSETNNICTPLSDELVKWLSSLSSDILISELNENLYTRQPYHIVLNQNERYPEARSYDLMSPGMNYLTFVKENVDVAEQMSVTSVQITHLVNGTGGFSLVMGVKKTEAATVVDESDIKILLIMTDRAGAKYYLEAEYVGVYSDVISLYNVQIPTNYHITSDDYFQTQLYDETWTAVTSELALTTDIDIRIMIAASDDPDVTQDSTMAADIPSKYSAYLVAACQTMNVTFGVNKSSDIYNVVTTTWGAYAYATYPEDIYYTYPNTVYQKDEKGLLVFRKSTSTTGTSLIDDVVLHNAGKYMVNNSDLTITTTMPQTLIGATINAPVTPGLLVGMSITGLGIAPDTTIEAIGADGTITLSQETTISVPANTVLTVANPSGMVRTTANAAVGSPIPVATVDGLVVGLSAYGLDIPADAKIIAIDTKNKTITLSPAPTVVVSSHTLITYENTTGNFKVKYSAGEVMLDANNTPRVVSERANQYLISSIQFDARLYASQSTIDTTYVANIPKQLASYTESMSPIKTRLIEQTNVYFRPSRALGNASFNIGDGATKTMGLGLSFAFTLYVDAATLANEKLQTILKENAITVVESHMSDAVISTLTIAQDIMTKLGTDVISISQGGINNDSSLQVISLVDEDAVASVERILTEDTDGTLTTEPAITIGFALATDEI